MFLISLPVISKIALFFLSRVVFGSGGSQLRLGFQRGVWALPVPVSLFRLAHSCLPAHGFSSINLARPLLARPPDQVAAFLGTCNRVCSDSPPWERASAFLPIDSGQESHQVTLTFPTTPPWHHPWPPASGLFI